MFAEFNFYVQSPREYEKNGIKKKDELHITMERQDEVNESVYCARLAFSLVMMRKLLASGFSEAFGEESRELV